MTEGQSQVILDPATNVILYHGGCPDGFCGAFLASKRFPEADLYPMSHGAEPPYDLIRNKRVLVIDFSWHRSIVVSLHSNARSFIVVDHHVTAEKALTGLDYAVFDMSKSGATLMWDILHPGEPRPAYVNYVEDRDLGRIFKGTSTLPHSREFNDYIMALPLTVEAWEELDRTRFDDIVAGGMAIRRQIDFYVRSTVEQRQLGRIGSALTAVVNAPYQNSSDVGDALCEFADVGLIWFERGDGLMQFGLRSRGDLDVSDIAKGFGGGGHKNASGFQLAVRKGRQVLDTILGR